MSSPNHIKAYHISIILLVKETHVSEYGQCYYRGANENQI
jgi:hypothetical protein